MEAIYGREQWLDRMRGFISDAQSGVGRLVLLTGEPGIGKSRLAEQVAADAAQAGVEVAWGRCWEAGGAPAYWPWMQVFRRLAMDEDPFAGAASDLALGTAEARFALFDRAVRSLLKIAERRALLLVLDDLHAADASSLLLLLLLSRELRHSRLLVVGAYRDAEALEVPLLAKLEREAEVLPLARLSAQDVSLWLRSAAPQVDAARAAELQRTTEGHPLFIVETLRLELAAETRPARATGPRAVLDERLSRLSAATRAVLEVAAVLGREFDASAVAAAACMSQDRVHAELNEALRQSIVVETTAAQRFRFSHVLLRDRLYAELIPSVRDALHFRVGTQAARHGDPGTAAHHMFLGAGAGPSVAVATVALAAAEAALSRLAFEEANQLARRALALTDADGWPAALSCTLEVVAAEASIRLGDSEAGKALCLQAALRARAAGDAALLGRAALAYATELATGMVEPQMIALLRDALEQLAPQDSPLRSRLLARLCAALTPPVDPADTTEILALMRESMAMARRLGDPHARLYVLQFAGTVGLLVPEQERFSALEESITLARALNQPLVLLATLPQYLTQLVALGGLAEASAMLAEYEELLGGSRQPGHWVRYYAVRALIEAVRGDRAAAEELGRRARELAHGASGSGPLFTWITHRVALADLYGEPEKLTPEQADVLGLWGRVQTSEQYVAWFLAATAETAQARARLHALDLSPHALGFPRLWELHAAAQACVLLGDTRFAQALYPHAVRAADRMFWTVGPGAVVGPSARALGDLAMLLGRTADAAQHYAAAIAACEQIGAPLLAARCRDARARLSSVPAPCPVVAPLAPVLQREGDVWAIHDGRGGPGVRVRHGKGMDYLALLLASPDRELHVLELAGLERRPGDAGPVLDARAKAAYRARLDALREVRAEAERFGDVARVSAAEREIQALAEQLARAVGLGGRDRRAASDVERVRINVQRRLKDAIERIKALDPALGKYLAATVRSGTSCSYRPL